MKYCGRVVKLPPRTLQYSAGVTDHVIDVSGRRDVKMAVRDGEHHATETYAFSKTTASSANVSKLGLAMEGKEKVQADL